jgi:hypothetical protein
MPIVDVRLSVKTICCKLYRYYRQQFVDDGFDDGIVTEEIDPEYDPKKKIRETSGI